MVPLRLDSSRLLLVVAAADCKISRHDPIKPFHYRRLRIPRWCPAASRNNTGERNTTKIRVIAYRYRCCGNAIMAERYPAQSRRGLSRTITSPERCIHVSLREVPCVILYSRTLKTQRCLSTSIYCGVKTVWKQVLAITWRIFNVPFLYIAPFSCFMFPSNCLLCVSHIVSFCVMTRHVSLK